VLARQHTNRSQPVLQCKVLQKVLLQSSMRPARICLASVLCSHALLPPQRRITPRRRSTGSLKAYNELRALTGVAAAARLGTREPCAALAAAAALASIKVLPRESIIYAWGWTVILPLSLALTLIGRESNGIKDGAATRRVGAAFAAGAVSSVAGAFAAAKLLRPTLGAAADKGAAALAASYVGGSANFFVVAEAVGLKNNGLLAALATADVVVMAAYIVLLQFLASKYGAPRPDVAVSKTTDDAGSPLVPALLGALCVAAAAPLKPSLRTAAISAYAVACRRVTIARSAARRMAGWCLAAFYACLGACSPVSAILKAGAPAVGLAVAALMGHALLLAACTVKGPWGVDEGIVASNACVGGPATAAAFALSTRREDLVVPAVVWGTVGYACGTGLGMALYNNMLC
jgi:uncharacterized membrane protein